MSKDEFRHIIRTDKHGEVELEAADLDTLKDLFAYLAVYKGAFVAIGGDQDMIEKFDQAIDSVVTEIKSRK